jgi:RNA polymerase sigma-54 factor
VIKQSLQLRLGQQLTLTPQLQLAIRLLQLPVLDLQAELREALEKNVMLEMDDGLGAGSERERSEGEAAGGDAEAPTAEAEDSRDLPDDLPYAETSDLGMGRGGRPPEDGDDQRDFADAAGTSLRDYLLGQLDLAFQDGRRKLIAMAIIDAVDEGGYLSDDLATIAATLTPEVVADEEEIERVLACLQRFEPLGVCARDLSECLLLQLAPLAPDTPALDLARRLAADCLPDLGDQDYTAIRRRLECSAEDLELAVALLRSLSPRPGAAVDTRPPEYVVPDVA